MNNDNLNNTNIIDIPDEDPSINSAKPVMNLQNTSIVNQDNKVVSEGFDKVDNSFYEKERKIWPIVLILIILAIVGLGCYYYFVLTKPINIIKKTLDGVYSSIEKNLNNIDFDNEYKTLTLKSNLIFTSNNEDLKDLSGISVDTLIGYDFKNKNKNIADVSVEINKEKKMDFAMSVINNNTYLDFKDEYSKIVYLEDNGAFELEVTGVDKDSSQNYLYLMKTLKNGLLDNISEEKLSKKMLMKDVDGKKVPAIEVTYNIDYPEYKKIHNAIIDKLLNDSKSISILSQIIGLNDSMIKDLLQNSKDNISELDLTNDLKLTLTVEALTNKMVELVLTDGEGTLKLVDKSNEMVMDLTSEELSGNITIDKNESKVFADVKMGEDFRFSIASKIETISKEEGNITLTFVLYDSKDINKEMDTVAFSINIKLNDEIKPLNITDAVNFNDLSQSEQEKINNIIMNYFDYFSLIQ